MGKDKKNSKLSLTWEEDENKERGNWTGKADFLLSTIGYAVGLGNVWRFPYKAYEGGGASFLIPYVVFLFTCGVPMFFLELTLGQFASRGPITVWNSVPFFKGIGWGMVMVSFLVCIYYNMIIAYSLYYLFASFTSKLPWSECKDEWMRVNISGTLSTCVDRASNYTEIKQARVDWCNTNTDDMTTAEYMFTCNSTKKTPALMYWERDVLDISEGLDDGQYELKWQLVLCLLLSWIIVFLCLCRGVKSSGKVVYFTAIFPYVVLIILCIKNALLPGSLEGIKYYMKPDVERLKDHQVWYSAAIQIFYSLGIAFGGLMTMSSYNRFQNNCYRDSVLVATINCGTSIFAGFVIFSVIGYMSEITGENIATVVDSGPGLAFVAYPEGIATMPVAPLWSILFFMMILTLGLDTQFGMLETVVTALVDEFEIKKKHKWGHTILCLILCVFMFLVGLTQCTRAGVFVMNLFDWYCAGYSLILIAFFEVIAIAWIYGFRRYQEDIMMMVGQLKMAFCIRTSFNYYWFPCWLIISPGMMLFIFVLMCINFGHITFTGVTDAYPMWADGVGLLMVILAVMFLPFFALVEFGAQYGLTNRSFVQAIQNVMKPMPSWGPALNEHRALGNGRYDPLPDDGAEIGNVMNGVSTVDHKQAEASGYPAVHNPGVNNQAYSQGLSYVPYSREDGADLQNSRL